MDKVLSFVTLFDVERGPTPLTHKAGPSSHLNLGHGLCPIMSSVSLHSSVSRLPETTSCSSKVTVFISSTFYSNQASETISVKLNTSVSNSKLLTVTDSVSSNSAPSYPIQVYNLCPGESNKCVKFLPEVESVRGTVTAPTS